MNGARVLALVLFATALSASIARSATFGDLSGSVRPPQPPEAGLYSSSPYAAGPYAASPYGSPDYGYGAGYGYAPGPPLAGAQSPSGGREGVPPSDAQGAPPPAPLPPNAYPPYGPYAGEPRGAVRRETFGQFNSTTDPFNPWGLSTPFMFVPWTTPLSGWTNAQTWNWWRERSGAPPANW
jgi:hypothetical protein